MANLAHNMPGSPCHPCHPCDPCDPSHVVPPPNWKTGPPEKPVKSGCPQSYQLSKVTMDKEIQPYLDFVDDQNKMSIRTNKENRSHTRKIHQLAKFKMEQWLAQSRQDLEERRDRLYTMLEDEDNCFQKELVHRHESRQTNQLNEMRGRVMELRATRQERQKKFVDQKLDECFQNQCEQMRSLLSKRLTKEIVQDWGTQIEMKNRLECESQHEERLWAHLSDLDIQEKERREEASNEIRREAVKRGLADLEQQVKLKNMKKAEAHKIKLRELAMIDADLKFLQEERENKIREKEEKFLRNKVHVKEMIDMRNYYRDRKVKREEIAAREFLKKAVQNLYLEQEDRNKMKRELLRAIQVYRDYTRQRDCLENEKEDVVQRIIDDVIEEQHKKTMAFRKSEMRQRHELHCSVQAGRALQVADKLNKRKLEEEEQRKELELIKNDWKSYLQELEQDKLNSEATRAQYVCDLNGQVRYKAKMAERDAQEENRQEEMCKIEERLFQNRVQSTLKEATLARSNPYRNCYVGKPVRQCFRQV